MSVVAQEADGLIAQPAFERLKSHVITATGLDYYRGRSSEFALHVARRLRACGADDCASYLALLHGGSEGRVELDALIEDLTIGETYFFRHAGLFAALENTILPDVIARNSAHRRLRIWSAGSSTGAEAYSVSILLKRSFAQRIRGWETTIVGTDINRAFLARAARAQYDDWALRGVSDELKRGCFDRSGRAWVLRPQYREGVSFQYHNLVEHPFPSMLHNLFAFDVILCRNVMIYFCDAVIARIVNKMRRCLVGGGWLLVGHAEYRSALFDEFRTVHFDKSVAYQRVDSTATSLADDRPRRVVDPRSSHAPAKGGSPKPPSPAVRRPRRATRSSRPLPPDPVDELEAIRTLADRGEIEGAVVRCERLLEKHKLHPTCHLYHALLLEQLSRHDACEQALRRAIYLDRCFVLAHYYLGLTLHRLGRRAEAVRSMRNVTQLLAEIPPERPIDNSDGLTAAELADLARLQLEAIQA